MQRGKTRETNKDTSEKVKKIQASYMDRLSTTKSFSVQIQEIREAPLENQETINKFILIGALQ